MRPFIALLAVLAITTPAHAFDQRRMEKRMSGLHAGHPVARQDAPYIDPNLRGRARHVFEKVERHLRRRVAVAHDLSEYLIERCGPKRCRALVIYEGGAFTWELCSAPRFRVKCRRVGLEP